MRHEEHRISTAQLAEAIEALLETGPCIIDEIADALGYSTGAVRLRLLQLMMEGRIHRRRICRDDNPALYYRWHIGAADAGLGGTLHGDLSPVQVTVSVYPEVNRRDPLVAAFFGQHGARANDARRLMQA